MSKSYKGYKSRRNLKRNIYKLKSDLVLKSFDLINKIQELGIE